MTLPDADRPDVARPVPPPPGRGWWNPLTRAVALVLLTVGLAGLAGAVTVTVRLTGTWPAACTVELLAAAAYGAVIVRVAAVSAAPARTGGRR